MVLEVFESARRPKCHVTASLRHVRRLESARTPKKAPPSARGAIAKRVVSNARSAIFGIGGHFQTYGHVPHGRFFGWTKIPSRTAIAPQHVREARRHRRAPELRGRRRAPAAQDTRARDDEGGRRPHVVPQARQPLIAIVPRVEHRERGMGLRGVVRGRELAADEDAQAQARGPHLGHRPTLLPGAGARRRLCDGGVSRAALRRRLHELLLPEARVAESGVGEYLVVLDDH